MTDQEQWLKVTSIQNKLSVLRTEETALRNKIVENLKNQRELEIQKFEIEYKSNIGDIIIKDKIRYVITNYWFAGDAIFMGVNLLKVCQNGQYGKKVYNTNKWEMIGVTNLTKIQANCNNEDLPVFDEEKI